MITILNISDTKFSYNGIAYFKNFTPFVTGNKISIVNAYDSCLSLTNFPTNYTDISVNGVTYGSVAALQDALLGVLYTRNSLTNAIIALTTTGNSGAATLVGTTLNIPNYTLAGLGGIGGTLSTGFIPKATGSGTLGNSLIYDNGTSIGIGTTSPSAKLHVLGKGIFDIGSSSGDVLVVDKLSGGNIAFNINGVYSGQIGAVGSGDLYIASKSKYPAIVVKDGGNVGIGTTSPNYASAGRQVVDINGSSQSMLALSVGGVGKSFLFYTGTDLLVSNESNGAIKFNTNGSEKAIITSGGNVGIGTTSPSYTLHVNGSVAGTSAYNNLSDKRYKKDILPIQNALDKILALNGVTFNWDKEATDMNLDDNNHIGLLAQDVEEILPQAVTTGTDENKTKSVAYTDLVPVLIEAIKELKSEIQILKN